MRNSVYVDNNMGNHKSETVDPSELIKQVRFITITFIMDYTPTGTELVSRDIFILSTSESTPNVSFHERRSGYSDQGKRFE